MLDEATLSVNVLQFAGKSFDFDRVVEVGGTAFAVFGRTETETEAKLRPELVRMRVVVPLEWVVYDEASDTLGLVRGGGAAAPRQRRAAGTTMLEPEEFRDQGIDWRRTSLPDLHRLYVPREFAERLLSPEGRAALGLPP